MTRKWYCEISGTDKYIGSYLQIYNIAFTNMLSVGVADFEVIRYGVAICGKRVFEYIKSKDYDRSLSRSQGIRLALKSPSKAIAFFSKYIFSRTLINVNEINC